MLLAFNVNAKLKNLIRGGVRFSEPTLNLNVLSCAVRQFALFFVVPHAFFAIALVLAISFGTGTFGADISHVYNTNDIILQLLFEQK